MNIQMIQRSIGSSTGMENHLVLIYLANDQELWSTCSPSASSHLQKRGRRSPSLGSRRVSEYVLGNPRLGHMITRSMDNNARISMMQIRVQNSF